MSCITYTCIKKHKQYFTDNLLEPDKIQQLAFPAEYNHFLCHWSIPTPPKNMKIQLSFNPNTVTPFSIYENKTVKKFYLCDKFSYRRSSPSNKFDKISPIVFSWISSFSTSIPDSRTAASNTNLRFAIS